MDGVWEYYETWSVMDFMPTLSDQFHGNLIRHAFAHLTYVAKKPNRIDLIKQTSLPGVLHTMQEHYSMDKRTLISTWVARERLQFQRQIGITRYFTSMGDEFTQKKVEADIHRVDLRIPRL
jgi:hypothetical protein